MYAKVSHKPHRPTWIVITTQEWIQFNKIVNKKKYEFNTPLKSFRRPIQIQDHKKNAMWTLAIDLGPSEEVGGKSFLFKSNDRKT